MSMQKNLNSTNIDLGFKFQSNLTGEPVWLFFYSSDIMESSRLDVVVPSGKIVDGLTHEGCARVTPG